MGFSICNIEINDIYDIISILCALIILCIIIYIIPKYNKNLKFEKSFFNHKAIKVLVIVLLLYFYLFMDISLFLLILTLIFFIYWILNSNENFEDEILNEENINEENINEDKINENKNNKNNINENTKIKNYNSYNLKTIVDNPMKPFNDNTDGLIDLRNEDIEEERNYNAINYQQEDYINYKQPYDYISDKFDCK